MLWTKGEVTQAATAAAPSQLGLAAWELWCLSHKRQLGHMHNLLAIACLEWTPPSASSVAPGATWCVHAATTPYPTTSEWLCYSNFQGNYKIDMDQGITNCRVLHEEYLIGSYYLLAYLLHFLVSSRMIFCLISSWISGNHMIVVLHVWHLWDWSQR